LFVEVAGQNHELRALYFLHSLFPDSKRSAGRDNLHQTKEI